MPIRLTAVLGGALWFAAAVLAQSSLPSPDIAPTPASSTPGVSAGQTGPATTPVHVMKMHVSERGLVRREAPGDPLVRVTPEELASLVETFRKATRAFEEAQKLRSAPPTTPQTLPPAVRSLDIEGETRGQTARLRMTMEVALAGGTLGSLIPFPRSWSLESARLPDPGDRIRFSSDPERTPCYVPMRSGVHRIVLEVAIPIQADRSQRSFTIELPRAPAQKLTLAISGPASAVTLSPEWLPLRVESSPGEGATLSATLGSSPRVTISWMVHAGKTVSSQRVATTPTPRPAPPPVPAGPRLFASVATLHTIGDGIVRFHSWIDLVNSRERVPTVDLAVPLEVQIRQVTGPMVKAFEFSPRNDTRVVRVVLTEPFKGRTRLEVVGEVGIRIGQNDTPTRVALPLVTVPGAVRVHGMVGVCAFATYRLQPENGQKDIAKIDTSELPPEVTRSSLSPVLLAFRHTSPHSRLAIQLTRFEPHERLKMAIQQINAVTVLSPTSVKKSDGKNESKIRTYTRMVLKMANAGEQDLKFSLPADAQIVSCFVDLIPQSPARLGDKGRVVTYLIPLKLSPVLENQLIPYPVEISYRQDLARRHGPIESVDLDFPQIGAPVANANWALYTPEGQRVVSVAGSFHEIVTERDLLLVTYGQHIFELVIYRGGRLLCQLALFLGLPFLLWSFLSRRSAIRDASGPPAPATSFLRPVIILIPVMIAAVMASIAVPNFKAARERASTRACYANQKTIAGAMEMFNLDKNTKRTCLDAAYFQELKSGGYLQSIPQDPGSGPASETHYRYTSSGNGITCTVHGAIQE